jgi:hypothetical protein
MTSDNAVSYTDAVNKLKQLGIKDEKIYLIDLILLIEMIWADGQAQESEVEILENYLEQHIANVNKRAGCKVLSLQDAREFVQPYIEKCPSDKTLKNLRELVAPVRLMVKNDKENKKLKEELLCVCMDIASIATTEYPYPSNGRFDENEKECFFNIQRALS